MKKNAKNKRAKVIAKTLSEPVWNIRLKYLSPEERTRIGRSIGLFAIPGGRPPTRLFGYLDIFVGVQWLEKHVNWRRIDVQRTTEKIKGSLPPGIYTAQLIGYDVSNKKPIIKVIE